MNKNIIQRQTNMHKGINQAKIIYPTQIKEHAHVNYNYNKATQSRFPIAIVFKPFSPFNFLLSLCITLVHTLYAHFKFKVGTFGLSKIDTTIHGKEGSDMELY